jgi:hypothetical protein
MRVAVEHGGDELALSAQSPEPHGFIGTPSVHFNWEKSESSPVSLISGFRGR